MRELSLRGMCHRALRFIPRKASCDFPRVSCERDPASDSPCGVAGVAQRRIRRADEGRIQSVAGARRGGASNDGCGRPTGVLIGADHYAWRTGQAVSGAPATARHWFCRHVFTAVTAVAHVSGTHLRCSSHSPGPRPRHHACGNSGAAAPRALRRADTRHDRRLRQGAGPDTRHHRHAPRPQWCSDSISSHRSRAGRSARGSRCEPAFRGAAKRRLATRCLQVVISGSRPPD